MLKQLILILIALVTSIHSQAQDLSKWEGHYLGELSSESASGRSMSYHMELKVGKLNDSTYNWTIIYGEDSLQQERKYLVKSTKQENHFIMDEQNSILLNFTLINDCFYSVFEVNGSLLHVQYQLIGDEIRFILSSSNNKTVTGGTLNEGEEIPIVTTYLTWTSQSAVLKKIK